MALKHAVKHLPKGKSVVEIRKAMNTIEDSQFWEKLSPEIKMKTMENFVVATFNLLYALGLCRAVLSKKGKSSGRKKRIFDSTIIVQG